MIKEDQKSKDIVKDKYARLANEENAGCGSCCGSEKSQNKVYNIMMEDYSSEKGYIPEADLGLGCGLPTEFAHIQPGDTVVDLGSGAGNDCFVARHETGPEGKVIGIDFTSAMIQKARGNAEKHKFNNVEFREGDIEDMPINADTANVVVSNCVLNLVPNKKRVISEIFRILKPGGHFSISDIVLRGELPKALRNDAEMYAGCVAGAIQQDEYISHIEEQGFQDIQIQKEKPIQLPETVLQQHLSPAEVKQYLRENTGIYSITVFAEKPSRAERGVPKQENQVKKGNSPCC